MITNVKTLPPGTLLFYQVERDALGNEVYTGPPVIVGGTGETLAEPQPATYATPPVPKTTIPPSTETPGGRTLEETALEGVRAGDYQAGSTDAVYPTLVTGWQAPNNVKGSDNAYAYTYALDSVYSDALELSGFAFDIPPGAIITGIQVTVERNKL